MDCDCEHTRVYLVAKNENCIAILSHAFPIVPGCHLLWQMSSQCGSQKKFSKLSGSFTYDFYHIFEFNEIAIT